ncbi:MAG: outer membrane protein assembly factor [Planctomycetes bacterium]|nr:outer membrane protein assembly factor [Planctomycetota bacterium]
MRLRATAPLLAPLALLCAAAPVAAQEAAPAGAPAPAASAVVPIRSAEGATIRAVRFEGATRLTPELLALQVKTRAGAAWSERIADDDLKSLAARFQVWATVRVEALPDGQVDVVFALEQVPSVSRVLFKGNRELDEEELRAALDLSENNALPASTVAGDGLAVLVYQLEDHYRAEGYLFAEIVPNVTRQGDERVLEFDILEGPEVAVNELDFVGLEHFDPGHIRDLMKTSRTFWFFTQTYKPAELEDDIVQIEQFLIDEGWLDARVAVESVTPDRSAGEVDILIRIEQGPRYLVRKVDFVGNEQFTRTELEALLRMTPGTPYRQTVYRKDRARILKHVRHLGFVRAEMPVRPIEGFAADGAALVDVTYRLHEDERKRVRAVRVVGNENTRDDVIRRELDLHPGDLFDGDEMLAAEDRLRATGFFIDSRGLPLAWVENERTEDPHAEDIVMKVEDGTAGLFTLFGGLASGQGFFLGTDLTIDNFDMADLPSSPGGLFPEFLDQRAFHGAGQRLRLRANPGNQFSNYLIQFTEPYLTGPRQNPVFLDLNFHVREFRSRHYDQNTVGGEFSIGKRISRRQSVAVGLRQDRIAIDRIVDRADPIEDLLAVEGGNSVRGLGVDWEYRAFDSLRNPTAGYRLNAGVELVGGPLGLQYDLWKASGGAEWMIPLFENEEEQRHVLSLRGAIAEVRPWGDTDDVPLFERWFAGGPATFLQGRGFEFRGIGPHDGDFSVGGDAGWVINTEYIFPLYDIYEPRLRENQPFLRGVVFADQGMLEESWGGLHDGKWRLAVGVGLRIKIPFQLFSAPLELYYGVPLQKASEDERESFQINFSTRF